MGLVTSPQSDPRTDWTWAHFTVLKIIKNTCECVESVLNYPGEIGVYLRTQKGHTVFGRMLTCRGECISSDVSRKDSNTRMQSQFEPVGFDVNCDAGRQRGTNQSSIDPERGIHYLWQYDSESVVEVNPSSPRNHNKASPAVSAMSAFGSNTLTLNP